MNAHGPADRKKVVRPLMVFVIAIAVVLVAYIGLVLFGGRIPGNTLLLPFVPIWLWWAVEGIRLGRHQRLAPHRFTSWEGRPTWMRLMGVLAYLLSFAIVAGLLVRYYLL